MTRNYSPLYPDCLAGALCAFEGLRGAIALMNGPTGCKYYNSYLVDRQDPGGFSFDPIPFGEKFYFGQPRVPASAVEGEDYVYGTGPKVRALLGHIKFRPDLQMLGIVNSPGPALIGDELQREVRAAGIMQPVVYIESPGFTNSSADGYQNAMIEILRRIPDEETRVASDFVQLDALRMGDRRQKATRVNLIGFMIGQHNSADDLKEIRRMLELLGLEVNVNIGAGEELDKLRHVPAAACNLILSEEYGFRIAAYLKQRFDLPHFGSGLLSPYGIEASEIWARSLSEKFALDMSAFTRETESVRQKCYSALSRVASVRGVPRGLTFANFGDGYQVAPLCHFLYRYLGMYPEVIGVRDCGPDNRRFLNTLISREGLNGTALLESPNQIQIAEVFRSRRPEFVFGSHFEERLAAAEIPEGRFIGISFPLWSRFQLTERPLVGLRGVLVIVEEILNSLTCKVDLPE